MQFPSKAPTKSWPKFDLRVGQHFISAPDSEIAFLADLESPAGNSRGPAKSGNEARIRFQSRITFSSCRSLATVSLRVWSWDAAARASSLVSVRRSSFDKSSLRRSANAVKLESGTEFASSSLEKKDESVVLSFFARFGRGPLLIFLLRNAGHFKFSWQGHSCLFFRV